MIAHARADFPNECCGILAGVNETVKQVYPTKNAEASPVKYLIDTNDLFQVYTDVDEKGWEFLGFYHSHTFTEAYPSPTDVRLATWPDSLYLLVSLKNPENPQLRAFHIKDNQITEEDLVIQN